MTDSFLLTCLDEIEKKETNLLVWGLTDFSFSHDEIYNFLETIIENDLSNNSLNFNDPEQILEKLYDKGLVHRFLKDDDYHYRSRMAETIRLMSKLRQLFPDHEGNNAWREAATLVGDYRFQSKPRKFPKRDTTINQLLSKINSLNLPYDQLDLIKSLIGNNFKLSGFQERAIIDILGKVNNKKNSGSIVCAGTGSGKTLSFYLPSLTRIGSHIINDSTYWVKALAIYPRNELLKDQFSEIYSESRKLDSILKIKGSRKIIIGAFFGPTPKNTSLFFDSNQAPNGWEKVANGFYCQYIRCVTTNCHGKLLWSINDLKNNKEKLICQSCNYTINEDEIILTRERMKSNPPDILFTSTEMLNQRMSDSSYNHLFGIGAKSMKSPEFMLLDEVHTYSGLHGAQVGYLIRRWHHLVNSNVVFVGLSATLTNAKGFFATLVGLKEWQVEEISPNFNELEKKGAEYNLVLRGDPVSRRSLLSTTIQTTMLSSRLLDQRNQKVSDGYFGSKVFVFTDDIDVTNRLYFNTLDAEGRDSFGRPDLVSKPNGGLAYLRQERLSDSRYEFGQDWRFCQNLNHDLRERMEVGRTSSQDPGANSEDDIIIATASLEVGFNDPEVGAIIQHKAPHDMAQFIQRKGRAGRSTKMRPWTIVILSDYGRDRVFYQSYEQLFEPELKTRHIPINNRYVQRMQSVYALIDYLGYNLQNSFKEGSVWANLSSPLGTQDQFKNYENNIVKPRLEQIKKELKNLLESDQAFQKFQKYLIGAFGLKVNSNSYELIHSLLWEFPRSLMTIVIPKMIRRIESNWSINGVERQENYKFNSPLMEFIPSTLFSDLNLPEVEVVLNNNQNDENNSVLMPIFHAMKDFAPGRVSKRFTIEHRYIAHWISYSPININIAEYNLEIDSFTNTKYLGEFNLSKDKSKNEKIKVYRPLQLRPTRPQNQINDTSNAMLNWFTEMVTNYLPLKLEPPRSGFWNRTIKEIEFYLHNNHNPVEIRRFSTGSDASIKFKDGNNLNAKFNFINNQEAVALGVSQFVDGILFKIDVPKEIWKEQNENSDEKWNSLKISRYYDLAWKGEYYLTTVGNPFARDWLSQIYLTALICISLDKNTDLSNAIEILKNEPIKFIDILEVIFQSETIGEENPQIENIDFQDQLRQELTSYLEDNEVLNSLESLTRETIVSDINISWQPWLKQHYISTLSSAIFYAIEQLCTDLDTSSLIVDINHLHLNATSDLSEVWITENSTGGLGVIEEVIIRYGESSKKFWGLVQNALEPTEHELIDKQLRKTLNLLSSNENLKNCFNSIRERKTLDTDKYLEKVKTILNNEGINIYHSFMSSLNTRILRPGTDDTTDEFLYKALEFWVKEEKRLKIEIDLRIISYHFSQWSEADNLFESNIEDLSNSNEAYLKYNTICGLLWPKGREIRQRYLSTYNPFHKPPISDRLLITDSLASEINILEIGSNDWKTESLKILSNKGNIRLIFPISEKEIIKDVFNFFMTNPVEHDYLLLYPTIISIKNDTDNIEINLEILEAI